MLYVFLSLDLAHLCYALRLPGRIVHLEVSFDDHWSKYALRRLYSVDRLAQPNIDYVTLVGTRIVYSSITDQYNYYLQWV